MENIKIYGKIVFDPKDVTKKHADQASWKRMAMVMISGDITEYYAWFLKRRYNIELSKPLRGAHISFINDSIRDIQSGLKCNEKQAKKAWVKLKKKYDGKKIEIILNISPRSDGYHWWLNVPNEFRTELHSIRNEVGLGRPHFGIHMSIGRAEDKYGVYDSETNAVKAKKLNLAHSKYILKLINKGLTNE